jgi:hypothetical protein
MLRDEPDFPPPQKLPRELDQWRSPVAGFPGRNPHQFVVMESRLGRSEVLPAALNLHQVIALLAKLLGDHRVTIDSGMKARDVRHSRLGWRFEQYHISLHCLLSWLASADAWRQLDAIGSTHFSIDAHRGGGKTRELVWRFEWDQGGAPRLRVRTKHFTKGEATEVNDLVSTFLRNSADAGAVYGRAGLVQVPPTHRHTSPEPLFESVSRVFHWEKALDTGRPVVPWVQRVNLLDASRLEQLGGIEALKPFVVGSEGLQLESHGTHVIIWTNRLATWHFDDCLESSDGEDHLSFAAEGLLHLFAKAGMLPVQNMDWVLAQTEVWRREADPKTRSKLAQPVRVRGRPMSEWLQHLQTRPPRWLAGCAAAPSTGLPPKFADQFHPGCVHFAISPPEGKSALTLYGAPIGSPVLVGSPVLAGSPSRDRAVAVFDQLSDGWDAQCVLEEDRPPIQACRVHQFKCPSCDGRLFRLRAILEYPDDLDELPERDKARAEEFFTWLWIVATCASCNWCGIAADVECA